MPIRELSFTEIPPTFIAILQRVVGPLITLLMLVALIHWYKLPITTEYSTLAVIALLLHALLFRGIDTNYSWGRIGARVQIISFFVSWFWFSLIIVAIGLATDLYLSYPLELVSIWLLVTPFVVLLAHTSIRLLLRYSLEKSGNRRSVVIAGINEHGKALAQNIEEDFHLGMSLKGFFEDRAVERFGQLDSPLLGHLDALPAYVQKHRINIVYITLPMMQEARILRLLDELKDTTTSIYFVPDFFMHDLVQSRVDYVNGTPALAICETPFYGVNGLIKRVSDIFISGIALVALSPLMLLIAVILKLTSPGPVIFKQSRYGLDGEEIKVYKFRTMNVWEDGKDIKQATKDDPRITGFGRILRKTSMDELPQFFNVFLGSMSVVGPRPHAVEHNEIYRKLIKGYMVRHKVKPGITGWAQVNGYRGETETLDKMKDRIKYDLDYLRHWSNALDVKIILRTIWVVIRDRNAY